MAKASVWSWVTETEVETGIGRLHLNGSLPAMGTQVTILIKPDAAAQTSEVFGEALLRTTSEVLEGTVTAVSFRGRYTQIWLQICKETLLLEFNQLPSVHVGQMLQFSLYSEQVNIL